MEAVVIDAGSSLLKAGFAIPDQDPSMIIPTKMQGMVEGDESADQEVFQDISVDPIVRGVISNWDAMEDLLHYVFYAGLGWEVGNEGQVLFADPLQTRKAIRELLVQLMFETFNVTGFYASEQAVLSLYAAGRLSGCAVDVGHGKIDIASVWEGAVQHSASKKFEIGGVDLTELFARELGKSNPKVSLNLSIVEKLKETYACTAEDQKAYEEKNKTFLEEKHTLPDGQVISIGKERYTVGEALFQPSILGIDEYSIVEQLNHCTSCVPFENQRQLLENTVLCGGTTAMFGFEDRFQKEAMLALSTSIRPALVKPPEYMSENMLRNSAWIGGAILAKVVFPQNQHITKAEGAAFAKVFFLQYQHVTNAVYDESGPTIHANTGFQYIAVKAQFETSSSGSFSYLIVELGDFVAFIGAASILLESVIGGATISRSWISYFATLCNRRSNAFRIHTNLAQNYNELDPIAVVVLFTTAIIAIRSTKLTSRINK